MCRYTVGIAETRFQRKRVIPLSGLLTMYDTALPHGSYVTAAGDFLFPKIFFKKDLTNAN